MHHRCFTPVIALVSAACLVACGGASSRGASGSPVPASGAAYDVVIVNGRVVDGSGNAWFYGDVGIRGDRIARITLDVPGFFQGDGFGKVAGGEWLVGVRHRRQQDIAMAAFDIGFDQGAILGLQSLQRRFHCR